MKYLLTFLCIISQPAKCIYAQEQIHETLKTLRSSDVFVTADYLNISVEVWDNDYIEVRSNVLINKGNAEAIQELIIEHTKEGISINSKVDVSMIENMAFVNYADGRRDMISMKEWKDCQMEDGTGYKVNFGIDIQGGVVVKLPQGMNMLIECTYGDIATKGSYSALSAHSTYGKVEVELYSLLGMEKLSLEATYDFVDLSIPKESDISLNLSSTYGDIYTDLALTYPENLTSDIRGNSGNYVLNRGTVSAHVVATYDNIYIRGLK